MYIEDLRKAWEGLSKQDALWAILSHADKKGNQWDIDAFFKTGEVEIARLMEQLQLLALDPPKTRALDFGCGIGRLTQALGHHFEQVHGIDIAEPMIAMANQQNRWGSKCQYMLNPNPDLAVFPDNFFTFVYSNITLQHIHPDYSTRYIKEFGRILAPGGLVVFQLPSACVNNKTLANLVFQRQLSLVQLLILKAPWLLRLHHRIVNKPVMEIHWVPRTNVEQLLTASGLRVVNVKENQSGGAGLVSFQYFAVKC